MRQEEEYKTQISHLREARLEYRKRFHQATYKMAGLLEEIKGNPLSEEIPTVYYEDLSNFEKGIWYNIDNEIFIRLEDNLNDKVLKFTTIYQPGAKVGLKKLDSLHSIHVNEGKLIDLTNNKIYVEGDEVIYLAYQPHELASDVYSNYTAYIHKPH